MMSLQILLVIVPSITYPLICLSYINILKQKHKEVDRLFQGEILNKYKKAYGGEDLFKYYYPWAGYILPTVLIMTTVMAVMISLLAKGDVLSIDSSKILSSLKGIPDTSIAGLIGAYVWTHYEIFRRFYIIDLSPIRLYYVWLRFLISGILAYFFGLALQSPTNLIIAFAIGTFPVSTIASFLRGQAKDKLKITDEVIEFEKPNLHMLQGMTKNVIERLNEENIYSIEHLALANPIRLLMRTNIEWTIILDFIDQAILFNYVGEKLTEVRNAGIRCAMELSQLQEDLYDKNDNKRMLAENLVKIVADKLGWDCESVRNFISTLAEDDQLNFISNLWFEAFPQ